MAEYAYNPITGNLDRVGSGSGPPPDVSQSMVYIKSGLIDSLSTLPQPLFTIAAGKTFIPILWFLEFVEIVNMTVEPLFNIGTNSPDFDNWQSGSWSNAFSGSTYVQTPFDNVPIALATAGTTPTILFQFPSTADIATCYVYILGIYK